ncbi:linear amide C-N hydrolase [Vibrio splendidus]
MNQFKKIAKKIGLISLLAPALHVGAVLACTSIALEAQDGAVVYGRTMEWGTFDLHSRVAIIPRGYEFEGSTPDGKPGMRWKAKYGAVALDAIQKDYMMDGMNEQGLVVGLLYHPGVAKYPEYNPSNSDHTIGSLEIVNYVLTSFSTVDEVKEGLDKVQVVGIIEPALGIEAPIHLTVIDASGKAIVVEYLNGKLAIFDNPTRALTNSPSFDWHMTNLRNYINLTGAALPTKTLVRGSENVDLAPIGAGTGFLNLPGDFTPPSRFIRAVAFTETARETADADETVYEVLRIMDNFNLPLGAAEGPAAESGQLDGMRSSTIWTSAADSKNLKYYYHTQHNRKVRMIDLNNIDFSANNSHIQHLELDVKKVQEIDDITPIN